MLFKLAFTKVTTTDDAAPTGTPASIFDVPDHHDRPGDMPTASVAVFVEFLDVSSAEVAGASCSMRMWLQDQRSSKWYRVDAKKTYVGGRTGIAFAFPPLNANVKAYIQVTDVVGSGITQIKVYAAETGAITPGYDPVTGALRTMDILQRGGEMNALAAHMIVERAIGSSEGACAWDDSAALESSSVVKPLPGTLYGFSMSAAGATAVAGWLQFFDSITVPADGAVPKLIFQLPAQPHTRVEVIPGNRRFFPTGISWAISSTPATKTLVTGGALNQHFGQVAYG